MNVPSFPPGYVEQNVGSYTLTVAIAFIILEIIFVALRFTSRHLSKTHSGLDDVFIVPSLVFCLGICVLAIVEVKVAGVGRHMDVLLALDPSAVIRWAKCGYAVEQLYCTAVVFPKLAILGLYLRIFTTKPYRMTCYVIAGIVVANGIAGVITSLASCHPFAARWDLTRTDANCIDTLQYWRWINLANIVTDIMMLGLPLPVVWSLHVSRTQKFGLTLVFLTGSIGLVASIVRFTIFFNVKALSDGTFISAKLATWSLVEPGVYLIAACLPSLRPLLLSLFTHVSSAIDFKHMKRYGSTTASNASRDIPPGGDLIKGSRIESGEAKDTGFLRLQGITVGKSGFTDLYKDEVRSVEAGDGGGFSDGERTNEIRM